MAMQITLPRKDFLIRCGYCQATVQVTTDWIGKKVRCSACQAIIVVPPPPAPVSAKMVATPTQDYSDRVKIESSDSLVPSALEDSRIGPGIPGEQAQASPAHVFEERLVHGVPVRPLLRFLGRLADLKAHFLSLRGKPAGIGDGGAKADQTAKAILDDIRDTVKRIQVAVKKMHHAHGDKVFPVLVKLREMDPAVSDRELREILYQAMKTFPEQFAEWEKAQALAEKKMRDAALEQETRMNRGLSAYQQGQYASAIEDLEKVVKRRPLNGQAHKFLGLSYLKLKQYENAGVHLSVAVALGSESAPLRYDLAVALLQAGHVNSAIRQLRTAITATPDFLPAVELLARIEKEG